MMFSSPDFFKGFSDLTSMIGQSIASFFSAPTSDTIKSNVFPLNQSPSVRNGYTREDVLRVLNGQTIQLTTRDNINLDAVWSTGDKENGPTAILFHGNGFTLDAMLDHAEWYHKRGINTLLVTIRGYPGSGGDTVKSGEIGLYLDVEEAVRYAAKTKGVSKDQIIAHGYSLGGSLAAAAGKFFGTYVTLDHTFTTLAGVGNHIANQTLNESCNTLHPSIRPSVPECIPKGIMEGTFPSGRVYANTEVSIVTDGLNTQEKMKTLKSDLFIFYGSEDPLMPTTFTDELYAAKYGAAPSEAYMNERKLYLQSKNDHTAMIPGGHWGVFAEHEEASNKYAHYLYSIGLMNSKYL